VKSFYIGYTKICVFTLACFLCLAGACSSFLVSRSWQALKEGEIAGTVWVGAIKADKAGGWSSVENEAADLLPLLFLERRLKTVETKEKADYIAKLSLREKEFSRRWKSRTSLSVELRLWSSKTAAGEWEMTVPLAAGQAFFQGEDSLSSSGTLGRLIRKAVEKAVTALPESQKTDYPGEEGTPAAGL
jgi:hypothetical protein